MTTTLDPQPADGTPSPTRAQRLLLAGVIFLLVVHVTATAMFVLGG